MGCIIFAGTNFQLFLLIIFSLCSNIATKSVYKFSKGCARRSEVMEVLVGNRFHNHCKYGCLTVFCNFLFILFYYSCIIYIQIFEWLHSAILELQEFWWEMCWIWSFLVTIYLYKIINLKFWQIPRPTSTFATRDFVAKVNVGPHNFSRSES